MAKKKTKPKPHPHYVMRRAVEEFGVDSAIVGVSGKDAVAVLDLCSQFFSRVQPYFMYLVPNLEFQESYLRYIERKYQVEVWRLPHWNLSELIQGSVFRHVSARAQKMSKLRAADVDAWLRKKSGIQWIATGEKTCDSLERNAKIKKEDGVSLKRRRIWPVAYWSEGDVFAYLRRHNIAVQHDYANPKATRAHSFGSLWYRQIVWVRDTYPEDFAKIVKMFPLIPAQIIRYEQMEAEKKAEKKV